MPKNILSQKRVKELFHYNSETGDLIRKVRTSSNANAGDKAGSLNKSTGYINIHIDGFKYKAHRVIWLWMTGEWPKDQIDHENHIRHDNKWLNISPATNQENGKNIKLPIDNTSGTIGISWAKREKKWEAYIHVNGVKKALGYFSDKNEAIAARKAAEIKYGFHPNHGRK